mmetsp:Transcript_85180/g.246278  ORF Transcript_85180/g.246278 Transcript_85180/m.246278 type:complete len:215 (-) Transcript_85180:651-1295(-)
MSTGRRVASCNLAASSLAARSAARWWRLASGLGCAARALRVASKPRCLSSMRAVASAMRGDRRESSTSGASVPASTLSASESSSSSSRSWSDGLGGRWRLPPPAVDSLSLLEFSVPLECREAPSSNTQPPSSSASATKSPYCVSTMARPSAEGKEPLAFSMLSRLARFISMSRCKVRATSPSQPPGKYKSGLCVKASSDGCRNLICFKQALKLP